MNRRRDAVMSRVVPLFRQGSDDPPASELTMLCTPFSRPRRYRRTHPAPGFGRWARGVWLLVVWAVAHVGQLVAVHGEDGADLDYVRDIAPIFEHRCQTCHGALNQEGGLRLDAGLLVRQGGSSGPVIVPQDPDRSLLLALITADEGEGRMPPEGKPVPADEVERIRRWIALGAPTPEKEEIPVGPKEHWFFQPPVASPLPDVTDPRFAVHAVDRFLAAGWEQAGVTPQAPADRSTLLRRVTFDLTGLPPTPEELRAFLADDSERAYEAVVDRLLQSTAYGERWGRHWLDIWRYTDPIYDTSCQQGGLVLAEYHMWRYRDWVIESLNANKGYDQMIREMLAGDELAPTAPEVRRATGYLTRSRTALGDRDTFLQDVVEHAGQAFLGLTLRCARCHDHKYDPISQEEYFRFRAYFESISVRLDRLPGGKTARDVGVNSIADGDERETFLYVNGSAMQPDKQRGPLSPRALSLFGVAAPEPAAISVPPEVAYPGLQRWIQDDAIAAAELAVTTVKEALKSIGADDPTPTSESPADSAAAVETPSVVPQKQQLAQAEVALAEARLAVVQAVIAADRAAAEAATEAQSAEDQPAHADRQSKASTLAKQASRLQRREALAIAHRDVAKDELALTEARQPGGEGQPADQDAITQAEAKVSAARKKRDELQSQIDNEQQDNESEEYKGLSDRYAHQSTGRRTALAQWMTDRRNPATARVAVNHVWFRHFGSPLVSTVQDFGLNGRRPSHPQLIDWLAIDFMEHGWSLKHLHRVIVTSQAYRMSSARRPGDFSEQHDPENRLFWRMNPRRLEAEAIRDALWAMGPGLDRSAGGPPIPIDQSNTSPRRSVYLNHTADDRDMMLRVFDSANPDECYRREDSVAPHQSLALTNGEFVHRMAEAAADRFSREAGSDDRAFVRVAFERMLCRAPTDRETTHCLQLLASLSAAMAQAAAESPTPIEPASPAPSSSDPSSAAAASASASNASSSTTRSPSAAGRISVIRALINTAEFITLR
jgi:hypothetical protein